MRFSYALEAHGGHRVDLAGPLACPLCSVDTPPDGQVGRPHNNVEPLYALLVSLLLVPQMLGLQRHQQVGMAVVVTVMMTVLLMMMMVRRTPTSALMTGTMPTMMTTSPPAITTPPMMSEIWRNVRLCCDS